MTQTPTINSGFDIIMDKGTNWTPSTGNDGTDDGLNPTTGPSWNSVQISMLGDEGMLSGFGFAMKYWQETSSPSGSPSYSYPTWTLVSQTITPLSPPTVPFFTTNSGSELFTIPTGEVVGGSVSGKGGITDGTQYDYLRVFDEAELTWLPRLSTAATQMVNQNYVRTIDNIDTSLPSPQLPMDTVSAFVPDERESVTVSYRVDTTYSTLLGGTQSYSFVITQLCTQDVSNFKKLLEKVLDNCYFTHGFYHMGLYEVDALPNYDSNANVINGGVIEPQYAIDQAASEVAGFTVYRITNGEAPPVGDIGVTEDGTVVLESDIEALEAEKARQDKLVEEMLAGLGPIMEATQKESIKELERISEVQAQYQEEIRANTERRDKIISNLASQINSDSDYKDKLKPGDSVITFESIMSKIIEKSGGGENEE